MFYPRVGKDEQGKDKRVNMQFFTKDIPAINEYAKQKDSTFGGFLRFAGNKLNPMAMTVLQAMTNNDYMGRPIGDLPAKVLYVLRQMAPISVQNVLAGGKDLMTQVQKHPGDVIMDFLGYSPSARWTRQSAIENEIITRAYHPDHKALSDAREKYRQAYLDHDVKTMAQAAGELKKLKATDKQIANIRKDAHLSSAQKAWKHLSKPEKAEMLKKMSPEEQKEFAQ